jgi:hypothetical protein
MAASTLRVAGEGDVRLMIALVWLEGLSILRFE